ncbi:acyl carrier protein [Sorangium cellulosum]|uniref:Acyl carrier protein n=1 Tax=Sorangium cellulosum TaxID=56 RepID=A0A4P2PYC7_SORCE|nr:acyl carrier protein [Sorangium cellulosum]AUX21867.1 acyl carrier protein [Sorangium cellulosum]
MSIADQVMQIIAEHLEKDVEELNPDALFVQDMGADSLDLSELVIAFEQTFNIRVPPEHAAQIRSPRSAIEYIEARASGAPGKTA